MKGSAMAGADGRITAELRDVLGIWAVTLVGAVLTVVYLYFM
jgi:hypothetical protein